MSRNDPSAHMEQSWDTVYSLSSLTAVILMTRFVCRMFHRLWATALDDDVENKSVQQKCTIVITILSTADPARTHKGLGDVKIFFYVPNEDVTVCLQPSNGIVHDWSRIV